MIFEDNCWFDLIWKISNYIFHKKLQTIYLSLKEQLKIWEFSGEVKTLDSVDELKVDERTLLMEDFCLDISDDDDINFEHEHEEEKEEEVISFGGGGIGLLVVRKEEEEGLLERGWEKEDNL